MQRIPGLFISNSGTIGRGVFTAEFISSGSLIEICPVLVIPKGEVDAIHETELHDYYFIWGEEDEAAAIALGYGSYTTIHTNQTQILFWIWITNPLISIQSKTYR